MVDYEHEHDDDYDWQARGARGKRDSRGDPVSFRYIGYLDHHLTWRFGSV